MEQGLRDLKVYQMAFRLAMQVYEVSKGFPKDERFALTDQVRRSSRSVAANTAEAYRKRQYPNAFCLKLSDADAEATETGIWLDFARECGLLAEPQHAELTAAYAELGRMLGAMMLYPERFAPRHHPENSYPDATANRVLTAYCRCLLPTSSHD